MSTTIDPASATLARASRLLALTAPRSRVLRGWGLEDVVAWEAGNQPR